jgi:hypothetical protein
MVILHGVNHLRTLLGIVAPEGSAVGGAVSSVAMAVMLTIVVVCSIMLAIAVRRSAMGGGVSGQGPRPHVGRSGKAREAPTDAWSEAGRRMPVPPREDEAP